jgi:hypothetical protein
MLENTPECNRRELLAAGATGAGILLADSAAAQVVQDAAGRNSRLRVTDIETHEITVPYQDWIAYELNHFYGPTRAPSMLSARIGADRPG